MSALCMHIGFCLLFLLIPKVGSGRPEGDLQLTLERAIEVYREALEEEDRSVRLKLFADAALWFQQAADWQLAAGTEPSADLWANAGHAALQAEQLGHAILAYRRALMANPQHPAAASNLRLARERLPRHLQPQKRDSIWSALFFWNDVLAGQAALWAAICFCVAMFLWAVAIRTGRSMYRGLAVVPAVLWLALLVSSYAAKHTNDAGAAVVIRSGIVARTADSRNAPAQFSNPLPEGVEVSIVDSRPDWLHVLLPSGTTTWLPSSGVASVYAN